MKTAVDIRYLPPIYFQVKPGESTFSDKAAHNVSIEAAIPQGSSYQAGTALKCFIISAVRAAIIVLTMLVKTVSALLVLVELIFRSTISGLGKY